MVPGGRLFTNLLGFRDYNDRLDQEKYHLRAREYLGPFSRSRYPSNLGGNYTRHVRSFSRGHPGYAGYDDFSGWGSRYPPRRGLRPHRSTPWLTRDHMSPRYHRAGPPLIPIHHRRPVRLRRGGHGHRSHWPATRGRLRRYRRSAHRAPGHLYSSSESSRERSLTTDFERLALGNTSTGSISSFLSSSSDGTSSYERYDPSHHRRNNAYHSRRRDHGQRQNGPDNAWENYPAHAGRAERLGQDMSRDGERYQTPHGNGISSPHPGHSRNGSQDSW